MARKHRNNKPPKRRDKDRSAPAEPKGHHAQESNQRLSKDERPGPSHKGPRGKRIGVASTPEKRIADFLTVGWMMSVLTALGCEIGSAVARMAAGEEDMLGLLAGYLLFAALVIGTISLILAAVVHKLRRTPPPRGITVVAITVGLAPWAALLLSLGR